jgi:hypothetical protein
MQPILGDDCKCWNALIDGVAYWWAENRAWRTKDEEQMNLKALRLKAIVMRVM